MKSVFEKTVDKALWRLLLVLLTAALALAFLRLLFGPAKKLSDRTSTNGRHEANGIGQAEAR